MADIVKIPKKLRAVFDNLRNGQIDLGIEQLTKIQGFEPQKAAALAEINYFKNNYEEAMAYDEKALPFDEEWYAGNILSEHFSAYTNAAILSKNIIRAKEFYKHYLKEKEKLNLPEHMIHSYSYQIKQHLLKLDGVKNLKIDPEPISIIEDNFSKDIYIEQLKKYRPKVAYDSNEGASYLLNFMFEKANTVETLKYYETYVNEITNAELNIFAARLYNALKNETKAINAIIMYTKNWYPVEHMQIEPMRLFAYDDLFSIFKIETKEKILNMPKAIK